MVDSGAIEIYARAFRQCRERGYTRNCQQYAQSRLEREFPQESPQSIRRAGELAQSAVERGRNANRGGRGYTIDDYSLNDPAETRRNAGDRGSSTYRYPTTVYYSINGPGISEQRSTSITITSRQQLTSGEIRDRAERDALRALSLTQARVGTPPTTTTLNIESVRIEAAFRDLA